MKRTSDRKSKKKPASFSRIILEGLRSGKLRRASLRLVKLGATLTQTAMAPNRTDLLRA